MKGFRFDNIDEVNKITKKELSAITEKKYKKCLEQWNHRSDKCFNYNEEYVEGG